MSAEDWDGVELEAYESEDTGGLSSIVVLPSFPDLTAYPEGAVFLGLHRRDTSSTQNVSATFSPTVFSNNSADTGECPHLFYNVASEPDFWGLVSTRTSSLGTLTESALFGPPSVLESDSDSE